MIYLNDEFFLKTGESKKSVSLKKKAKIQSKIINQSAIEQSVCEINL